VRPFGEQKSAASFKANFGWKKGSLLADLAARKVARHRPLNRLMAGALAADFSTTVSK